MIPCGCICTDRYPHDLDFSPGLRMPRVCNPCALAFAGGEHDTHRARGFHGWPPDPPCVLIGSNR